MADAARPTPQAVLVPARHTWSLPILRELPKLTELTLASAIGGTGGTGGGGSTVFALLLAVGILASGCASGESMEPSAPAIAPAVASISCTGDIATKVISCADPVGATGQVITGGQGKRVVLQSSDVQYVDAGSGVGDLTFNVQVRNISAQTMGFGSTGIRVFFEAAPVGVPGTITVADDSIGTFTAGGQHYYKYPGQLEKLEITAPLQWRFHMTGGVNTFTFNVLVAANVFDQGGVLRWESVDGFDQRKYNDVAAHSSSDRMVVGNNGVTAHWDGVQWTVLPAIVTDGINAITTGAPGEYFAATANGRVLHYDGKTWAVAHDYGDPATIFLDIWASGDSIVVAVGVNGKLSRRSPATGLWSDQVITLPGGGFLGAVSGNADGSRIGTINGASGQGEFFLATDGGAFLHNDSFGGFGGGATLKDVLYDADGIAILAMTSGPIGVVYTSAALTLDFGSFEPTSLVSLGSGHIAVGYSSGGSDLIKQIDYTGTPIATDITNALGLHFTQMTVVDAGTLQFQVVTPSTQQLYDWNGSAWAATQGGSTMVDPDLWGVGDSVWLLDGIGNFYKVVNGVSTPGPGLPGLHELLGQSSTSFFAATDADIYHSDGTSAWSLIAHPVVATPIKHLWVSPSGQMILASTVGTELYTSFFSGLLQFVDEVGATVTGMWGCDDVDIWITTDNGNIHRWASGGFDPSPYVTSSTPLRAITGSSCSDIWAVGDDGAAYYYDGSTWFDFSEPGGPTSFAAAIRGPGQVIVAGPSGVGGFFTYFGGFQNGDIPTQSDNVTSLWRTSNGQLYAAGPHLLLRGMR